jgi:SAM-dependent methyltransferase
MIHKYPESFARFYDTIYHSMRDTADSDYFREEAVKAGGKVLEIGVGTGGLFMNALNSGVDIYGIDISETMLEILYKKLPQDHHYRISLQNIIDFRHDLKFNLIMAPFRVFMHLLEKDEQIRALNNIFDHLNAGGKFIFDTFVPDLKQLIKGLDNVTDFEGYYEPGRKIRRFVSTSPDLINQLINIKFHLEWDEGDKVNHDEWNVPLRFFFRYELEHLIERSKFRSYHIAGDYKGNGLNTDSKEFVVVCTKKGYL